MSEIVRELWIVNGREPCLWRIPVVVIWREKNEAEVIPAVALLRRQMEAFDAVVGLRGKSKKNNIWLIEGSDLDRIAVKLPGGDPEAYFSWGREEVPIVERVGKASQVGQDIMEMVDRAVLSGVGDNRELLTYYYLSFTKLMADRLLNEEKPVDLVFVKLHPSPYRANWKTILTSRFPRLGQMMAKRRIDHKSYNYLLDNEGFNSELKSLDLLALNHTEGYCYRRVEVEHLPKWWKLVRKSELNRLTKLGPYEYAAYFMRTIKRQMPVSTRLFHRWNTEIARLSAIAVQGDDTGLYRFAPVAHVIRWVKRVSARHIALPVVVPNKEPEIKQASKDVCLVVKDEKLSAMSDLQSGNENMRDGNVFQTEDVPEPEYEAI